MNAERLAVLDEYRPAMVVHIANRFRNALTQEDAEDVVSDVIVKFWERDSDPAMFATACRNRAIDVIRERQATTNTPVPLPEGPSFAERLEDRALVREILEALPSLSEGVRTALTGRLAGYGERELAKVQGCTIAASKTRVHRGIVALRAAGVGA